jgi:hypothetical protein
MHLGKIPVIVLRFSAGDPFGARLESDMAVVTVSVISIAGKHLAILDLKMRQLYAAFSELL